MIDKFCKICGSKNEVLLKPAGDVYCAETGERRYFIAECCPDKEREKDNHHLSIWKNNYKMHWKKNPDGYGDLRNIKTHDKGGYTKSDTRVDFQKKDRDGDTLNCWHYNDASWRSYKRATITDKKDWHDAIVEWEKSEYPQSEWWWEEKPISVSKQNQPTPWNRFCGWLGELVG